MQREIMSRSDVREFIKMWLNMGFSYLDFWYYINKPNDNGMDAHIKFNEDQIKKLNSISGPYAKTVIRAWYAQNKQLLFQIRKP